MQNMKTSFLYVYAVLSAIIKLMKLFTRVRGTSKYSYKNFLSKLLLQADPSGKTKKIQEKVEKY